MTRVIKALTVFLNQAASTSLVINTMAHSVQCVLDVR